MANKKVYAEYLDLSKFDAEPMIDFQEVWDKGYRGIILRAGYTGSKSSKPCAKDPYFEEWYKKLFDMGFELGCYYFSRATNAEEGVKEATWLYEKCLKGKKFSLPIWMDNEDNVYQAKVSRQDLTDAIIAFCETLENLGYYVGHYTNPSWMKGHIYMDQLTSYDCWMAHYTDKPYQKYDYAMWQNGGVRITGKGRDHNYCYKNYPKIIKKNGLNGWEKETPVDPQPTPPQPIPTEPDEFEVGDIVQIMGDGNSNPDGTGFERDAIGLRRYVLEVLEGKEYPNKVGYITGGYTFTAGYYKDSELKLLKRGE